MAHKSDHKGALDAREVRCHEPVTSRVSYRTQFLSLNYKIILPHPLFLRQKTYLQILPF